MKKTFLLFTTCAVLYAESIPMPPMPPSLGTAKTSKTKDEKQQMPKSCELMPPMVVFLPPPMEAGLSECKNELNKPKKEFVEKQLKRLLKKDVKVKTIEIVEKFDQLYKVTYNGGVILTNKTVDAFIEQ